MGRHDYGTSAPVPGYRRALLSRRLMARAGEHARRARIAACVMLAFWESSLWRGRSMTVRVNGLNGCDETRKNSLIPTAVAGSG